MMKDFLPIRLIYSWHGKPFIDRALAIPTTAEFPLMSLPNRPWLSQYPGIRSKNLGDPTEVRGGFSTAQILSYHTGDILFPVAHSPDSRLVLILLLIESGSNQGFPAAELELRHGRRLTRGTAAPLLYRVNRGELRTHLRQAFPLCIHQVGAWGFYEETCL